MVIGRYHLVRTKVVVKYQLEENNVTRWIHWNINSILSRELCEKRIIYSIIPSLHSEHNIPAVPNTERNERFQAICRWKCKIHLQLKTLHRLNTIHDTSDTALLFNFKKYTPRNYKPYLFKNKLQNIAAVIQFCSSSKINLCQVYMRRI